MRFLITVFFVFKLITAIADDEIPLEVLRVQKYAKSFSLKPVKPTFSFSSPPHTEFKKQSLPVSTEYRFIPGSLKENIVHLAKQLGWSTVIWQPSYDYQWVGISHFSQKNLKEILNEVLEHFPLQAIFYEGNHVLVITPRNIS